MKKNERVILIKGDASKWYDQAIFIVNKDMPPEKIPIDFVAEAEKIIHNYIAGKNKQIGRTVNQPSPSKTAIAAKQTRDKRFDITLNMMMLFGCLAIFGVVLFGMLN